MTLEQVRALPRPEAIRILAEEVMGWTWIHEAIAFTSVRGGCWSIKGRRYAEGKHWDPFTNPADSAQVRRKMAAQGLAFSIFIESTLVILRIIDAHGVIVAHATATGENAECEATGEAAIMAVMSEKGK